MGRKIPGKKHRGVKDPFKQHAKRLEELKTKINAPPKNPDDQGTPKSLQRVINLKNQVKNGMSMKKRKKRLKSGLINLGTQAIKLPHPKAKPEKIIPVFKQRPGETSEAFMHRVSRETEVFLQETKFENKYNVQVKRNVETGKIEGIEKKPKDEIEELLKLKSKHKNIKRKKKRKESEIEVKLTKVQKRKQKVNKKLQEKLDEFGSFKDFVRFGEVVHAPPELKIRPKNKKAEKEDNIRSGKKNLLLNSLLNKNKEPNAESQKCINKSGKRKDLPIGERMRLEKEQSDAIAVYRSLKIQK